MTVYEELERDLKVAGYHSKMTAREVARAMRCSVRSVWRLLRAGVLTRHGHGTNALFCRSQVARVMSDRR